MGHYPNMDVFFLYSDLFKDYPNKIISLLQLYSEINFQTQSAGWKNTLGLSFMPECHKIIYEGA